MINKKSSEEEEEEEEERRILIPGALYRLHMKEGETSLWAWKHTYDFIKPDNNLFKNSIKLKSNSILMLIELPREIDWPNGGLIEYHFLSLTASEEEEEEEEVGVRVGRAIPICCCWMYFNSPLSESEGERFVPLVVT
jgi:hypothetical protein